MSPVPNGSFPATPHLALPFNSRLLQSLTRNHRGSISHSKPLLSLPRSADKYFELKDIVVTRDTLLKLPFHSLFFLTHHYFWINLWSWPNDVAAFQKTARLSLLRSLSTVARHQSNVLKPTTHFETANGSGSITDRPTSLKPSLGVR